MKARTNKGIGTQLSSLVGGVLTICGVTLYGVPVAQPMVHAPLSPAVSGRKATLAPVHGIKTFNTHVMSQIDAPMLAMANGVNGANR